MGGELPCSVLVVKACKRYVKGWGSGENLVSWPADIPQRVFEG